MKKIVFLLGFIIATALTACHADSDNYFTDAVITLDAGENVVVEQVQATAKLENLNTHQVTTSSNFFTNTLQVNLLRGAYRVTIDGLMRYKDAGNHSHLKRFTSQADYVSLADEGMNIATIKAVFTE